MKNQPFFESKILAKRICEFKAKNSLTYQQLGDALGVDKSYLNRVVKMVSHMSMPVLIRLAKYMGIPLYVLLMPSEEMIRTEFVETLKLQMSEKNISTDELGETSGISPIRLIEILQGDSIITYKEYELLAEALQIEAPSYQADNLELLETLIFNLPMQDNKKDSVIQYIKENLE